MRTLRFLGLSWVLAFNVSCVGEYADDEEILLSSGAETVSNKRTQAACDQRWTGLSSVPSAQSVDYSGARSQCAGGPQSGAIKLGNFIRDNFAAYMDLSVPGNGVQIYNCRSVRGGRSRSVHGDGRAVDIFIPTLPGGVADNAKGDRIANWLAENSAEIGIQYIIWDRGSFMGERSPQSKCYTGSHPHNDHIHLELTWAGAREETPFFQRPADRSVPSETTDSQADGQPSSAPPERDTEARHDHEEEQPATPTAEDEPAIVGGSAWLGEPCNTDAQCIRDGTVPATCIVPEGTRWGFCSISCDGFCPDRAGHAETFCAKARMVGLGDIGLCMAKSEPINNYCAAYPDFEPFATNRFIDQSNAQARTATICAVARPRTIDSEDQSADDARALCGDDALPLSDHGRYCTTADEDRWRCACSERYETTVSQVCRNGAWVNYDLNPRDCGGCEGSYSSACEPR